MSLFDDSNDDSLIEIPVFVRIKSKMNANEDIGPDVRIDDSFDSLPAISEPPLIITDKSNETFTLDSDSEDKQMITNHDSTNDSIEVLFCSPTLQKPDTTEETPLDVNEDKAFDANISVLSFRSIGSTDWTPIKPNFINKTPLIQKTVRNRTQSSVKKSINILNNKKTNEQKAVEREDRIRKQNENKAQKEIQKLNEKTHKEVLKSRDQKNSKKYCFAIIDHNLYEVIKQSLDPLFAEKECNFRVTDSPFVSMSVTWVRKCLHLVDGHDSQLSGQSSQSSIGDTEVQQNYILVVIDTNEFIERVNSYITKSGETLFDFAKQVIQKSNLKNITLLVLKLEQYFKRLKTKAQNQFKQRLNELESNQTNRRRNRRESMPTITREDVDLALIDMEFKLMSFDSESKVSVIKANDYKEVSTYICRYTRSVAESLIRNEKKNQTIGWFAEADNKSTVDPTDDTSHQKLWKRQLMQFPKISYEVSNAIVSQYPTPRSLLDAYSGHPKPELLLADIVVSRRQASGQNTERKVGPQLSERIHLFMTSRNSEQLLNN